MTWVVTGKALDSPEKGNVDKMSEKCRTNVRKLSGGTGNTIFGQFLDIFCLFGRCFCVVTLSNARPLQDMGLLDYCRHQATMGQTMGQEGLLLSGTA